MSDTLPSSPLRSRVGTLILTREIGKGTSSVVYSSRTEHNLQYAVKAIRNRPDIKRYKRAVMEIAMHARIVRHCHIVPLIDSFSEPSEDTWPTYTYLIFPLAPGDLHSFIVDHKLYLNNPLLIRSVYLQIVSAVQHCHSLGIFHRDIKSENILAFDDGRRVMLADFGLATRNVRSREWGVGTVTYMSPECIGGPYETEEGYSTSANDVWSLGIILINLLTARFPWQKAILADSSFVAYCRAPNDYLIGSLPFSHQAHTILCHIFIEEQHRLGIVELLQFVTATRVWYDADAVFEGCRARWRQPDDRVTSDGWVSHSCEETSEQNDKECGAPPLPAPLSVPDCKEAHADFCGSPPGLQSASSQSGSLPEMLLTAPLTETNDLPRIVKASPYLDIERDSFPWLHPSEPHKLRHSTA